MATETVFDIVVNNQDQLLSTMDRLDKKLGGLIDTLRARGTPTISETVAGTPAEQRKTLSYLGQLQKRTQEQAELQKKIRIEQRKQLDDLAKNKGAYLRVGRGVDTVTGAQVEGLPSGGAKTGRGLGDYGDILGRKSSQIDRMLRNYNLPDDVKDSLEMFSSSMEEVGGYLESVNAAQAMLTEQYRKYSPLIQKTVIPALKKGLGAISEYAGPLKTVGSIAKSSAGKMASMASSLGGFMTGLPMVGGLFSKIGGLITGLVPALGGLIAGLGGISVVILPLIAAGVALAMVLKSINQRYEDQKKAAAEYLKVLEVAEDTRMDRAYKFQQLQKDLLDEDQNTVESARRESVQVYQDIADDWNKTAFELQYLQQEMQDSETRRLEYLAQGATGAAKAEKEHIEGLQERYGDLSQQFRFLDEDMLSTEAKLKDLGFTSTEIAYGIGELNDKLNDSARLLALLADRLGSIASETQNYQVEMEKLAANKDIAGLREYAANLIESRKEVVADSVLYRRQWQAVENERRQALERGDKETADVLTKAMEDIQRSGSDTEAKLKAMDNALGYLNTNFTELGLATEDFTLATSRTVDELRNLTRAETDLVDLRVQAQDIQKEAIASFNEWYADEQFNRNRELEDNERDRQKELKSHLEQMAEMETAFREQQAEALADLNESIADTIADFNKEQAESEVDYYKQLAEDTEDYQKEIIQTEKDYEKERIQRLKDLHEQLFELELDNDVLGFIQAQRSAEKEAEEADQEHKEEMAEMETSHREQQAEQQKQYEEQKAERLLQHQEQLMEMRANYEEQKAERIADYQEQRQERIDERNKRLAEEAEEEAFREKRRREDLQREMAAMQRRTAEQLAELDQREDELLKVIKDGGREQIEIVSWTQQQMIDVMNQKWNQAIKNLQKGAFGALTGSGSSSQKNAAGNLLGMISKGTSSLIGGIMGLTRRPAVAAAEGLFADKPTVTLMGDNGPELALPLKQGGGIPDSILNKLGNSVTLQIGSVRIGGDMTRSEVNEQFYKLQRTLVGVMDRAVSPS